MARLVPATESPLPVHPSLPARHYWQARPVAVPDWQAKMGRAALRAAARTRRRPQSVEKSVEKKAVKLEKLEWKWRLVQA